MCKSSNGFSVATVQNVCRLPWVGIFQSFRIHWWIASQLKREYCSLPALLILGNLPAIHHYNRRKYTISMYQNPSHRPKRIVQPADVHVVKISSRIPGKESLQEEWSEWTHCGILRRQVSKAHSSRRAGYAVHYQGFRPRNRVHTYQWYWYRISLAVQMIERGNFLSVNY